MEKVRYEEMLPHEIVKRRRKTPIAFIGMGGLEWHGEHLAVGNDALKAAKLCELAAAKSGGFAFPTLWYGEPRLLGLMESNHDPDGKIRKKMGLKKANFQGNVFGVSSEEQLDFYQRLVYHTLVEIRTLELKVICVLTGHYPIKGWIDPVVERFNSNFNDAIAYAGIEFHYPPKSKHVGGDHAAKWETSYLMYLRPDCVDMTVYLNRPDEQLIGVGGIDPRKEASIEVGRKAVDMIVDGMVKKGLELLEKVRGS